MKTPLDAEAYYNRAMSKLQQGDFSGAIADCNKSIGINPNFFVVYYVRGLSKNDIEDYNGAIADFTKAIEIEPNFIMAYSNRAGAKKALEDYNGAIADFTKSIEVNPHDARAMGDHDLATVYNDRGICKKELEDYDGAIADYDKAIELDPSFEGAKYNKAVAKLAMDFLNDAIKDTMLDAVNSTMQDRSKARDSIVDCTKAIELDPNDAEAYFNRGDSRYLLEDYSEAIADYNKAIEIDPNNVEAEVYFNRGDSKYHLEDYDGAIADFSIAIDLNPIYYEAYSKRGELRQMYNDFTEALADYTIAIEKGDEDPHRMALFNAMPEIEAISHQEERAKLYLNRGIVRNQLKNPKGALADANKSIELDGFAFVCEFRSINNIIVYFTLDAYCLRGMAKDDLGDFNGAIADYTKSIEIDSGPDNFMAHVQRAYTRRNLKDYNGAIADYDKMLEINPVFAEAFKALLKLDDNDADSGNAKEVEQGDTIRAEAKEGKNTRVDAQKAPELGEGKAKNKGNLFISLLVAFLTLIIVGIATEGSDEPFVMIMPAVASYLVFRWIRE